MATIRSYIFIDQLQPKTMCYLGTFIRGFLPRVNMAALVVEVSPGLEIENITDIAVKNVDVKPGLLVVERQYGYLEVHSHDTSSVKAAGQAILDYLEATEADAMRPEILASRIVKRVDNYHAFLINRNKAGSMVLPANRCSCWKCSRRPTLFWRLMKPRKPRISRWSTIA